MSAVAETKSATENSIGQFGLNKTHYSHSILPFAGVLACLVWWLSPNAMPALQPASETGVLTASDIAKVLNLHIMKFRFDQNETSESAAGLTYWVESFEPDGSKTLHDEAQIGLGNEATDVLIRLPHGPGAEFGVFSDVNSSLGKSKLKVDTETQGAEGWEFRKNKDLRAGENIIIAIRIIGGGYSPDGKTLDESLSTILKVEFTRVDVFKVRVQSYPR